MKLEIGKLYVTLDRWESLMFRYAGIKVRSGVVLMVIELPDGDIKGTFLHQEGILHWSEDSSLDFNPSVYLREAKITR